MSFQIRKIRVILRNKKSIYASRPLPAQKLPESGETLVNNNKKIV